MAKLLLLTAAAFAAGSIPFGVIVTRIFSSEDIRAKGSGNIGATNVTRVAGWLPGLATLALDLAKGALPVYVAKTVFHGSPDHAMAITGLAAVLGHTCPLFSGFRGGGKGVATAAGAFLVMAPAACLAAISVFILVASCSRRVSAGSVSAATCLPAATCFFYGTGPLLASSVATSLIVLIRHRSNLSRLLNGTEPPFFKKKHGKNGQ